MIDKHIGQLIITLEGAAKGATVTIGQDKVAPFNIGQPIAVLPGNKKITAIKEGLDPISREITINGGRIIAVALYAETKSVDPPLDQTDETVVEEDSSLSALQWLGIATMSVGVIGVITAGFTGAAAGAKLGALEQSCGEARCTDPATAEVIDSGKTFELVAYLSGGLGIAALLGGGALLIFGGDDQEPVAAHHRRQGGAQGGVKTSAAAAPLPGGGIFVLSGSF